MREADDACTLSTPVLPLATIAADLAITAARQAALARPDPAAWAALDPERRAGINALAQTLAADFLRLRRAALAAPVRNVPDLRALAAVIQRSEPPDDAAAVLARAVLDVHPAPVPVNDARFPTLHDLTAACCRFADDVDAMQRAEPSMAETIACVAMCVAADMVLSGPRLTAVRAALRQ